MMKKALTLLLVTTALTILTACGPDPVQRSESGELAAGDTTHPADGSFYDEYSFRAKEGWLITVTMTSTAVQPYVQLRIKDRGDEYLQESSAGTVTATAPESAEYIVWANSMSAGETGAYTVNISAQPTQ